MTKEEQCIEIAKLCGWEFKQCSDGTGPEWHRPDGSVDLCGNIPRYAYDLNAMHEAEEGLEPVERFQYENWLAALRANSAFTSSCTAAQRAEAFLRTHDKWKD